MSNSIGHGGVIDNPLSNSPYFKNKNYSSEISPPVMNRMLYEDGTVMLYEDGTVMLYEEN
jgi:hypothetical protein